MTPTILAWGKFAVCAALIGLAGPALTRYGDIIARRTGLSRTWIGLALLATATSLPELFTGISAVTIAAAPNIAVGNVLGACVFNLVLVALLDLLHRKEPMFRLVEQGHILSAGFAVVMIGVVGAAILLERDRAAPGVLHVGAYTPMIIVLYLVGMRAAFVYERRQIGRAQVEREDVGLSLRAAVIRYCIAAAIIVVAGVWLPFVGVEIAAAMDWRTTFVGTLFVSAATTLPEAVVTISALRIGALDLAVANLLGSILFNVLILAIDDVAYLPGPLLSAVSPIHAVTAFAAIVMSGILVIALVYRPSVRFQGTVGWVSLSLLVVYVLSVYVIYLHGH
jgi:cation:H+ antiporter